MIRVVLLDIDGVLTDGKVIVDSTGKEYKKMDFRDVDAVYALRGAGIRVGLVTGEDTPMAKYFQKRFKPDYFYSGCKEKLAAVEEVIALSGAAPDEICYMGDGRLDLPVFRSLQCTAAPSNAIREVRDLAKYKLSCAGGDGCVMELAEKILALNGASAGK
ncbi:MAG: hypothetical protein J6331_08660 [Lentisphaeria bacterium]|nr:hypothetical protein [Lentisphaeria bacterium]